MKNSHRLFFVVALVGVLASASLALADHSWGGYHWARTANPFTIKLGDNVSSAWDAYLAQTSSDWTASSVIDTVIVAGGTNATKGRNTPKNCLPTSGRAEICNAKYGSNGWLGIAQVWVSGTHITQGAVKMNDTYFNTSSYNTPAWRNLVMCQEVGHIFGLGHQDENFSNAALGTCMDYTNDPTPNQHPNQHDYDMLEAVYTHLDTTTTVSQSTASLPEDAESNDPKAWGREIERSADGRVSLFELDLGKGKKVFTHVFWAEPQEGRSH